MALRPLIAISILNIAVATGFVTGAIANTTPTGLAISVTRRSASTESDALGDLTGERVVDPEAGEADLQRLVGHVPEPGFADRGDRQFLRASGQQRRDVEQQRVDPLVGPVLEGRQGALRAGHDDVDVLVEQRIGRERFDQVVTGGASRGHLGGRIGSGRKRKGHHHELTIAVDAGLSHEAGVIMR